MIQHSHLSEVKIKKSNAPCKIAGKRYNPTGRPMREGGGGEIQLRRGTMFCGTHGFGGMGKKVTNLG